jgi:hypothetical protein
MKFASRYPPKRVFQNFVPKEFEGWVDSEISSLIEKKVILEWEPSMGGESPTVIAPLLVEPTKPRLIYDARYVNKFMELPEFSLDSVGKFASCGWKGMYTFTMDHKNGYVLPRTATPICLEILWFYLERKDLCIYHFVFWMVSSPLYTSSLTESVAAFIREIVMAPIMTWIDDIISGTTEKERALSDKEQFESAEFVIFIISMVYFYCGYFVSISKSVFQPSKLTKYLGILVDTENEKFLVPQSRVHGLCDLVRSILSLNLG